MFERFAKKHDSLANLTNKVLERMYTNLESAKTDEPEKIRSLLEEDIKLLGRIGKAHMYLQKTELRYLENEGLLTEN
ncbi:MAG: hypothetical protein HY831_02415 [Candidatus Aenigmarchaeota archaeon]|nr:hypothetical protein [Candidatus Aenigmarchaeota archaeon]